MTGVRIRLHSSFRFLWTAQSLIYAPRRRARNHKPVMPASNKERTCGYRRAPAEPDRNAPFRQFRSPQKRRIHPKAGQTALPVGNGDARACIAARSRLG